ncbi:MAG: beta strand repeat-containing protein, partial [Phycisphaerales bacterium]
MVRHEKKSRGMKSFGQYLSGAARSITSRLARAAGVAEAGKAPGVEQLEARRLMFSMTVTAADVIDPATGLGTVDAYFGYAIPYIATDSEVGQTPRVQEDENFNEQAVNQPLVAGAPRVLPGSKLRVESNIVPYNDLIVLGNAPEFTDRWVRANPGVGEFVRFSAASIEGVQNSAPASMFSFSVAIPRDPTRPDDGTGLVPTQFAVDVVYSNGETDSFSGAEFAQLTQSPDAAGFGTLEIQDARGLLSVTLRRTSPGVGDVPSFKLDNVNFSLFAGANAGLINARLFGAHVSLTGPVGASARVTDLLGRDMVRTLVVTPPPGGIVPWIDSNDDGVPEFNDGIGAITITGNDSRTAFSIYGGRVFSSDVLTATFNDLTGTPYADAYFGDFYHFQNLTDFGGLHDDFEDPEAGFGYSWREEGGNIKVGGLPPVGGSVIIGSPFIRGLQGTNPADYNAYSPFPPVITTGFNRSDQGIFVETGNMASITANAILHGTSRVAGFIDQFNASYMVGSLIVGGDLGSAVFGTDAGVWTDRGEDVNNVAIKTDSQLVVGRTLGSVLVAGRNLMDVTVVGDLDSPQDRPARDSYHYYEREVAQPGVDLNVQYLNASNGTGFVSRSATDLVSPRTAVAFAGTDYRNDDIAGAEFVSVSTAGVRINGDLATDPTTTNDDPVDVYAFSVKAGQLVAIQATSVGGDLNAAPYMRVLDYLGRPLAVTTEPFYRGRFQVSDLRYTPTADGVLYLAVTSDGATSDYSITINAMAPTALGEVRSGGGSGFVVERGPAFAVQNPPQLAGSITVLSGDVGSIRVGVSGSAAGGGEFDVLGIVNAVGDADQVTTLASGSFSVAGNLFQFAAGGDVGAGGGEAFPITLTVSGNLNQFLTGVSAGSGRSANEGDLNFTQVRVGGTIGDVKVSGGIGMDQDADDPRARISVVPNHVQFITGTAGGIGDIGMFRLGSHMVGGSLAMRTSPGSVVGAFLVSQDKYYADRPEDGRSGIYRGDATSISTGFGSDIRFADAPRFDASDEIRDVFFPLRSGEALEFTDDGGSKISITLTGVDPNATGNVVRVLPIDGSQGVTISGIDVNLAGPTGAGSGGTLTISSSNLQGTGSIGIGRITIAGGDATSGLVIQGTVEVDVYQIVQTGGDGFGDISNNTPDGDIVAADLSSVRNLTVRGNLGRAVTGTSGPNVTGPYLGFGQGIGDESEARLPVPVGSFDEDFNGAVVRPVADDDFRSGNHYLEDIGGPYDGALNGIILRTGNALSITADGSIGDVIVLGNVINSVTANNDLITALGEFDGIVGTLYAREIGTVNLGDGLAAADGALAKAGIFAADDIGRIETSVTSGVIVRGVISASNLVPIQNEQGDPNPDPNQPPQLALDGIDTISLSGADINGAFIGVGNLDRFYDGFIAIDDQVAVGTINTITLSNSTFLRSRIDGDRLGSLTMTGTDFDASTIVMRRSVNSISARSFKNSTLEGDDFERRESRIASGGDVRNLIAQNDIEDLVFDIVGSVLGSLTAVNITRSKIDVDNEIRGMNVSRDFRGSALTAGEMSTFGVGRNISNSTITLSGVVQSITAADRIVNTKITVTGPDAALQAVAAPNLIDGSVEVSGPIGTITVAAGDLDVSILTTTARGNVTGLSAARDLVVDANVSGAIGTLTAGRHIGRITDPTVILSRGDVVTVSVPNGQLYSDIRSGGSFTGTVTIGGATNKPGDVQVGRGSIIAFGRVAAVTINGDFGGDVISYTGGITSVAVLNGSLLKGSEISAFNGSLASLTITNGNLYGNVHADIDITLLTVTADANGVFGDVGINQALSQNTAFDARRNQLPAGVIPDATISGPRITAGNNVVSFTVTNGSLFETYLWAGRSILSLSVNGSIAKDGFTTGAPSVIAAGDSIDLVTVTGTASDARFIAGVTSFGANGIAGGTRASRDSMKSGDIRSVTIT